MIQIIKSFNFHQYLIIKMQRDGVHTQKFPGLIGPRPHKAGAYMNSIWCKILAVALLSNYHFQSTHLFMKRILTLNV